MCPRTAPIALVLLVFGCGVEDRDPCAQIKAKLTSCQVETSIPHEAQCSPDLLANHEAIIASDCGMLTEGKVDWWGLDGCESGTLRCYGLFCCQKPQLEEGDLVFRRSNTSFALTIGILTLSRWTHVGVVRLAGNTPKVLEAGSKVRLLNFDTFASLGTVAIKRLRDPLSDAQRAKIRQLGQSFLGRPYDKYFRWDDGHLYCSELVYKLYDRGANLQIGELQKFSDFDLSNPIVQGFIKKWYGSNPFSSMPQDEPVVSPTSMYSDPQLRTVF